MPTPLQYNIRKWTNREYDIHCYQMDGKWSHELHTHHGFFDLFFLTEGQLSHQIDGQTLTANPGDLNYISETSLHSMQGRDIRFYNINIRNEDWNRALDYLGQRKRWENEFGTQPFWSRRVPQQLRNRLHEYFAELLNSRGSLNGWRLLHEFMIFLLNELLLQEERSFNPQAPSWWDSLLRYIDAHLADRNLKPEMSQYIDLSPEHISRVFRKQLGITPSTYINQQRLNRAAQMLASTNAPIIDICYDVGYEQLSYFYRKFKELHHQSPSQYRKRHHTTQL
ncbi:MAG: helix-turn-helix domain-containing protein [Verrucomicrobiota bacterium]